MGKVRVKQDPEEATVDIGQMGAMATDLGKMLGIQLVVMRTADHWQDPRYGPPKIKYYYQIRASMPEHDMTFGRTSNPNEIKRSLAMLTDMIHMGFIKAEGSPDG